MADEVWVYVNSTRMGPMRRLHSAVKATSDLAHLVAFTNKRSRMRSKLMFPDVAEPYKLEANAGDQGATEH